MVLFSKTNASTFLLLSYNPTKQTCRVTYGGKTSLAKDIVQNVASNEHKPNWSENDVKSSKQSTKSYIVKNGIYKYN